MMTGTVTMEGAEVGREREGGRSAFDPRPWPLMVVMLAGLVGVFFALRVGDGRGQEGGARTSLRASLATPALPEAKETIEQGVTLTVEQGGERDVRSARVMSLYVPENAAPTPFLQGGPFTATFSGFVNLRLRGEFSFLVLGRGKVAVKINGKTVLEAQGEDFAQKSSAVLKMEKGKNPIEVLYTSPEKGDAWVRVLWSCREFPPEPVQPTVLSHDVAEKSLREAARLRAGREVLADLRCGNCHTLPAAAEGKGLAMLELKADAPDLSDAGARLKEGWMAAWISDPKKLRADASMPKLFHAANGTEAADVAAYLATLGKPAAAEGAEADDETVTQGSQLFAGLGCIGCHTKPDAEEADKEGGRVPLAMVNAKFQPGALKGWLMDPQAHYAWARMPNFHLTDFEADRLVAYLAKNAKGTAPEGAKGDVAKGKAIFAPR